MVSPTTGVFRARWKHRPERQKHKFEFSRGCDAQRPFSGIKTETPIAALSAITSRNFYSVVVECFSWRKAPALWFVDERCSSLKESN
ncbi:hypothetical protein GWI33_016853 [Rhynchophorus ferrugineus]|uniref:Uncharacterized protein n=1 Tax=Rhynchophorus ferrugineus TaxID=354439 RepID=A0A834M4J7_RHYFE|nr:hypothetical protein GWI33_016853 [Rhynchophorus ferrugineus]